MENVSRKQFVQAALGTAGVASLATMAKAGRADEAASAVSEVVYDEEFDVVVVGAGLAGAAAALTVASEGEGVSCLLIEKGSVPGGNSPMCDNSALYTDNADAMYNYLKDLSGDFPPSDEMIRAYADGFAENLDWLRSFGVTDDLMSAPFLEPSLVEYQEFGSDEGCVANVRLLNPENTDDNKYMHPFLLQQAQDHGVEYRLEAAAEHLIQDPVTGAITGVVVNGSNIKANRGVVMACGGFENSPEMLECFVQSGGATPAAARLNTGDGIKMAIEVGADLWHMSGWAGQWLAPVALDESMFLLIGVDVARQQIKRYGITVANNGRRFLHGL